MPGLSGEPQKDAAVEQLQAFFMDTHCRSMNSSPLSSDVLFDMSCIEPVLEELSKTQQERTQKAIVKIASRPLERQGPARKKIPKLKAPVKEPSGPPRRPTLPSRRPLPGGSGSSSAGRKKKEPIKSGRKAPDRKSRSTYFRR